MPFKGDNIIKLNSVKYIISETKHLNKVITRKIEHRNSKIQTAKNKIIK